MNGYPYAQVLKWYKWIILRSGGEGNYLRLKVEDWRLKVKGKRWKCLKFEMPKVPKIEKIRYQHQIVLKKTLGTLSTLGILGTTISLNPWPLGPLAPWNLILSPLAPRFLPLRPGNLGTLTPVFIASVCEKTSPGRGHSHGLYRAGYGPPRLTWKVR